MSGFTLFADSATGVSFEPEYGFKVADKKIENAARTRSGLLYKYKFSDYRKWDIPLRFVNSADKGTINGWWRENTALFFMDNNDTATVYNVLITNKSPPIDQVERPYDYEWKGKIELEEY